MKALIFLSVSVCNKSTDRLYSQSILNAAKCLNPEWENTLTGMPCKQVGLALFSLNRSNSVLPSLESSIFVLDAIPDTTSNRYCLKLNFLKVFPEARDTHWHIVCQRTVRRFWWWTRRTAQRPHWWSHPSNRWSIRVLWVGTTPWSCTRMRRR